VVDKNFIARQVMQLWENYDFENCGYLDKIEAANLVTEIMQNNNMVIPNVDQINSAFLRFDINDTGNIDKS
jgi:Ca2+-binding EF-hand superfamily protein